jgi:hypothetical protein
MKEKQKTIPGILLAAIFICLYTTSYSQSQTKPQKFVIMNVATGLVLDIDSTCNINPNNTTDGPSECNIVLSPFSKWKSAQRWTINQKDGFIYFANFKFNRIMGAGDDSVVRIQRFLYPPYYFYKAVDAGNDTYILLLGKPDITDLDENGDGKLKITYTCLQPDGNTVKLAAFDDQQKAKQSWKIVPVKDDPIMDIINDPSTNKLTPEDAKKFNEEIKDKNKNSNH